MIRLAKNDFDDVDMWEIFCEAIGVDYSLVDAVNFECRWKESGLEFKDLEQDDNPAHYKDD